MTQTSPRINFENIITLPEILDKLAKGSGSTEDSSLISFIAMASSSQSSNCGFYNIHEKACGFSSLSKAKDNVLLQDCTSDISKHLANCHLPKSLQEYEVILARAGVFRWSKEFLENTIICPTHRDELGKYWRLSKSCQYPSHKGKPKQLKDTHVINYIKVATEIFDLFGCTVPIGSRKSLFVCAPSY